VPHQAEEAPHRPHRARLRPVVDGLDLGRIHGHTRRGYGVPEVGDSVHAERALGALDEEKMLVEHRDDDAEVTQVVRPEGAVYQNITKEDKYKPAEVGTQHVIHE
jgi:hypothetical protein